MAWWQRLFGGSKAESDSPERNDPDLLEKKLKGLKAAKWVERQAAARKLVAGGGYAALWGHARLLGDDASRPEEVTRAHNALDKAAELAIPALRAALQDHVQVSTAAAKRLSEIGTPESLQALAETLGGEVCSGDFQKENGEVCAEQLFQLGDRGVPGLTKALAEGTPLARRRAAQTLGRIRAKNGLVDSQWRERAVHALAELLKHEEGSVRRAAAEALGQFGEEAASCTERLCDLLDDGPAVAAALKAIGPAAGPALIVRLSDPKTKRSAFQVLRELKYQHSSIIDHVLTIWKDPGEQTPELLRYMVTLSPEKFVGELEESLNCPKTKLVAEAARVVRDIVKGHPHIASQLEPSVRRAAKGAYERIRTLLANGSGVGEDDAFALASFGEVAHEYGSALRKDMEKAGKTALQNPWVIATMACLVSDPKPYFAALLEPMRNADNGKVEAPLLRIGPDGSAQMIADVRQVYGGALGNAFAYMSAWGANSPAMNSQNAIKRALSVLGEIGTKNLNDLRRQFPEQVDELVSK